jgi:LytR cell envelope-related transcriptional attenuator
MHLGSLLAVFRKYVQTDFTDPELISLANYYQGIPAGAIVSAQVPYTADINLPNYGDSLVPDSEARAHLVATMLVTPPTPIPSPDAMTLAAIPPSTLRVDVENGSGVTGAAHRVATLLRREGFTIATVGDADRSDYATTVIHEHSSVMYAGAKVRDALPPALHDAAVVPDSTPSASPAATDAQDSDVTVIVGTDFSKNAPPALDHS